MSLRLGTLLILTSGCATVSLDENAARIDNVIRAKDPIPEPLTVGTLDPLATGAWSPAGARVLQKPGATPAEAPEGYRWVPGRFGPKLMRQPGYLGVEIGEVRTGDVSIDTGPLRSPGRGIAVTSGR